MKRVQLKFAMLAIVLMICSEIAPATATPISGERCATGGSQVINSGILFTCTKGPNGFKWDSGSRCKKLGQKIRVNNQTYVCSTVKNSKVWIVPVVSNSGKVLFDAQGLDAKCESGKSGVHTSILISIRGLKTVSKRLQSGKELVELEKGKYSITLVPFVCNGRKYLPVLNSETVNVQVGKTSTVVLRYRVAFDRDFNFDKEFKRLTGLDSEAWDVNADSDPLTYKLRYEDLKDYERGALCSYIATGLDDFTLGFYISNEVSYDMDIQSALIAATRFAYGCSTA